MPVWAALLAWPVLGEVPTPRRLGGLACGLLALLVVVGGKGFDLGLAKLPGVALALSGSVLFALGTVMTKRWPLPLPAPAAVVWQVGLGSLPLAAATLLLERPDFAALSPRGWAFLAFMACFPLCLCYLAWFAALRRLPASLATLGTLLAPVIGVIGSAMLLGEGLGVKEGAALALTLGGVLLAVRG
ncbi:DMT family transporter [Siccirubricoccus sp. KC 17139]|uniref:DMT family transporter n=1 Tax=Siccirubricoccus soli TaxID=2899147 RepID=A0ABT1D7Z9_9PROT|nr:DMT family transporter [Siccirubricoccus soli]MCO6417090.1 DMT family transporter [Siccirubricoccus soli]MCP2683225.1 DMT family transporter [Siccirubricoccus soli]